MGGTEYVSFELFLGILSGPGEGRGGAPGTVPLQNREVTSRKACLRNAETGKQAVAAMNVLSGSPEGCELTSPERIFLDQQQLVRASATGVKRCKPFP